MVGFGGLGTNFNPFARRLISSCPSCLSLRLTTDLGSFTSGPLSLNGLSNDLEDHWLYQQASGFGLWGRWRIWRGEFGG